MMSILQLTRWKGGKHDEMVQAARAAKAIIEKHGAEFFRVSRFHTGPYVGEWLVATRYADWATYAKVQQAQADDAEYQALLSRVGAMAELTGRAVLVGIDL